MIGDRDLDVDYRRSTVKDTIKQDTSENITQQTTNDKSETDHARCKCSSNNTTKQASSI